MSHTSAIESDNLLRLFRTLADGDANACTQFWKLAWPFVRDYAARFLSAADAEDAAQEALAKILRQAPLFDQNRRLIPWMLTIAHFEVLTVRRRRFRRREEQAEVDQVDRAVLSADDDEGVTIQAILAAVQTLSDSDQQTLLAYLDDERPKSAVFRKRLQRSLARLRTAWSLAHPDEDSGDSV